MKKIYHRLAALSMAAAALSSCSRSAYTFNNQVPAYLGTAHATAVPSVATPEPAPTATVTAAAAPATAAATVPLPARRAAVAPVETTSPRPANVVASQLDASTAVAQSAKPTLAQRLVLKKVMKQLNKRELRQQNTAGVAKTAAKGSSLTVAIIGLAALVVGLIISSGLLITLGSIVLVVGIVLLILSIL